MFEYPQSEGDPYYPMPQPQNAELYGEYKTLAAALPNVHFAGRLGTYKYYNMDQVVAQALTLADKIVRRRSVDAENAIPPRGTNGGWHRKHQQ